MRSVFKKPNVLRHAYAFLGEVYQNAKTEKTADKRRNFRSQGPRNGDIRNTEANGSHYAVFPNGEAFFPAFVLAEEAGHEAEHADWKEEKHGKVHDGYEFADVIVNISRHGLRGDHFQRFISDILNGFETLDDGSSDSTERHRHAVEHQADNGGAKRRKAQAHEQRSRQSGRGAETGCAFNECSEHEADDNGLQTAVRSDFLHACLNCFHGSARLQCIIDKQSAENDDKHAESGDETLNGQSRDTDHVKIPNRKCQHSGGKPGKRHGAG